KMQPLLDVLGAAGDPAEHPTGLASWRRDGGDRCRSRLRRRSLAGRLRHACGMLLVRVGRGDLDHGGHWLRPIVENDLLRPARQSLRITDVLVAGESRIL